MTGAGSLYHRAPTPLLGDGDKGEVWVVNAGRHRAPCS